MLRFLGGINPYLYANANPLRFTDPKGLSPDYAPCAYYAAKCQETGCRYYCFTAPVICKNAENLPQFSDIGSEKLNCIRNCLVRRDQAAHEKAHGQQCPLGNPCLPDRTIDDYHRDCFAGCGVSPEKYPGVNPWWLPFNSNQQNAQRSW